MSVAQAVDRGDAGSARTSTQIIDTDIHEMLPSASALLPHLDPAWHRNITAGWSAPYFFSYAYPHEAGFARADSRPADGTPAGSDFELLREQLLERYDMTAAILTSLFYPGDSSVQYEFGSALACAYNDWLAENWLDKDERLRGSICVNVNDPAGAAAEIDRVAGHPKLVQVMLGPRRDGYGEPRYLPIFEAAARNGLPVAIHPSSNAPTAFGYPQYLIEWRAMATVQHGMSQVSSIVFSGLLERFPTLRISMLESGWTWIPFALGRYDDNYRILRSEVPWLKRMPSEYVYEHFRFSTQPLEEMTSERFMSFIDLIGSEDLLMFSSDYPHMDADDPVRAFPKIPDGLRHKILYENARNWYGL
ncbi:MAG TPA: amidohydrolase family protein [Solirubrobacteraceae bacterium]